MDYQQGVLRRYETWARKRCARFEIDADAQVKVPASVRAVADDYFPELGGGAWLAAAPAWEVLALVMRTPSGGLRRLFGSSTKVIKGVKYGVLTAVSYLAPASRSGFNLCPWAGLCGPLCLGHSSGHLRYSTAHRAGILKAWHYALFRASYLAQREREVVQHARKASKLGLVPAVRDEGSSDRHDLPAIPGVVHYDYTKAPPGRHMDRLRATRHLTYSLDGVHKLGTAAAWQERGVNVAVVVRSEAVAKRMVLAGNWLGRPVIDGDAHDVRFQDPEVGGWVVLYAKGHRAKADRTGFVLDEEHLDQLDAK